MAQRSWRPWLLSVAAGVAALGVLLPATAAQAAPTEGQIEAQISVQEKALEQVIEQYNLLGEQLTKAQAQVTVLQRSMAPLNAKVDAAQVQVGRIAAETYKSSLDPVNAVISAPDTKAVVDRLVTIAQLGQYENATIEGLKQDRAAQDTQLAALNSNIATVTAKRTQMVTQRKTIETGLKKLYALRAQAAPKPVAPSGAGSTPPAVSGKAGVAVKFAYAQLGKPYQYATAGPNTYDCSGLTMAAWAAAGVSLSHNAAEQWGEVAHISRGALQPGDLVFYSGLGHVAIYVGNGQVIHAPTQGDVVRIASVDMMPPYGYGRPT